MTAHREFHYFHVSLTHFDKDVRGLQSQISLVVQFIFIFIPYFFKITRKSIPKVGVFLGNEEEF